MPALWHDICDERACDKWGELKRWPVVPPFGKVLRWQGFLPFLYQLSVTSVSRCFFSAEHQPVERKLRFFGVQFLSRGRNARGTYHFSPLWMYLTIYSYPDGESVHFSVNNVWVGLSKMGREELRFLLPRSAVTSGCTTTLSGSLPFIELQLASVSSYRRCSTSRYQLRSGSVHTRKPYIYYFASDISNWELYVTSLICMLRLMWGTLQNSTSCLTAFLAWNLGNIAGQREWKLLWSYNNQII